MRSPPVVSRSSFEGDSVNLDLIRSVAVLCVFFGHLADISTGVQHELSWHFAQMGVLIFFVHTSFVLMLSLERSTARLRGKHLFQEFYIRRFFRLYPLAIFCVLCAFELHASPSLEQLTHRWTWKELASNLSLTMNLTYSDNMVGGSWTLPLEVQMYLVLPVSFLALRSRNAGYSAGLWAFSIPIGLLQPHVSARLITLSYAPCFIAGVLAWRVSLSAKRQLFGSLWPLAFLAVWPLFLLASRENQMLYRYLFCLVLGLALPHFAEFKLRPLRRLVQVIAKYSYGIYLSHIAVMLFAFRLPDPFRWPVFVLLAVASPVAMYHLIEHPFIKIGRHFSARSMSLDAPAMARTA